MTIISALITQCRREVGDMPKSVSVQRAGNGLVNLFNVGKFPVVEGSYTVYVSGVAKTESTHYTFDLDNGDLRILSTPANGVTVKSDHKYAFWRDQNWLEAFNAGIDDLNARGFFRQVLRDTTSIRLSANVQVYSGPTNAVDVYEFLVRSNYTTSGSLIKPSTNWSYQSDANQIVLGNKPTVGNYTAVSYLRRLRTYNATSATIDVLSDWEGLVQKKAMADFYRALAGKIAKQGNATIDEGHFSFTNLRTMANDLDLEYDRLARSKKPTRPAKDIGFNSPNGGIA